MPTGTMLYDAFGGGWDFELRGLRHYLEHHAGVPRLVVLARGPRAVPARESWRSPSGSPRIASAQRGVADCGARRAVHCATGERPKAVRRRGSSTTTSPIRRDGRAAQQRATPNRNALHGRQRHAVGLAVHLWNFCGTRPRHRAGVAGTCRRGVREREPIADFDVHFITELTLTPMADILQEFPIAVDPARVFQAVSEPRLLDEWWTLRSDGTPEVGASYELDFGPGYLWAADRDESGARHRVRAATDARRR